MNTLVCPRCELEMICEEYRNHKCIGEFKGTKTIPIKFYYDGGFDENNDKILMIISEDGFIYRGIQCIHLIPHNLPDQPTFDTDKNNHEFDRTLKQQL